MGLRKGIDFFRKYSLIKRLTYIGISFMGLSLLIYLSVQTGGALPAAFMIGCCLYGLWATGGFVTGVGIGASLFMDTKPEMHFKDELTKPTRAKNF